MANGCPGWANRSQNPYVPQSSNCTPRCWWSLEVFFPRKPSAFQISIGDSPEPPILTCHPVDVWPPPHPSKHTAPSLQRLAASLLNTSRNWGTFKERLFMWDQARGRKHCMRYRKGLPPNEKSLHTLRGKGKLFNKIARVWLWLIPKEEATNRRFFTNLHIPEAYEFHIRCHP